jgi:hypothetical protein
VGALSPDRGLVEARTWPEPHRTLGGKPERNSGGNPREPAEKPSETDGTRGETRENPDGSRVRERLGVY